jgi:hypothetical protein
MHVRLEQQLSEVQDSLSVAHVLLMHVLFSHLSPKQQSSVAVQEPLISLHLCVLQIPV